MLSTRSGRQFAATLCAVIAAFAAMELLAAAGAMSPLLKGLLVPICAYVVMAISLNLTVGILGELSLGHAGFMSVGAFTGVTAAMSLQNVVASDEARLICALIVGALFAGIVGFLVGIPVLRLNGDYLAIVTLAFGEIIKSVFNNLYLGLDSHGFHLSLLNNRLHLDEGGKLIIGGPMGIGGIRKIANFPTGFVLILVCLVIIFNLVNSRAGRAIMAIRDNRIAAESVGIPVTKYKMMAFVTSAAMAGTAGALFALNFSTIVANKFDFNTSILVLVFVVLGGLGNMLGSDVAAAALTVLPEALRQFADYRMLVYAIVANKFDFNTSILVLVFVVLGGLGNMLGSIVAAAALTVLPEALRQFADYRMLVYAIVLILVMLIRNNPTIRAFAGRLRPGGKGGAEE